MGSAVQKPINRSHTFHSNQCKNILEETNQAAHDEYPNFFLQDSNSRTDPSALDTQTISATLNKQILTNYVLKNGKRLLAWNRKHHVQSESSRLDSPSRSGVCESKPIEERLTNQIAAKLLSENIDLTKFPYTDEVKQFSTIS